MKYHVLPSCKRMLRKESCNCGPDSRYGHDHEKERQAVETASQQRHAYKFELELRKRQHAQLHPGRHYQRHKEERERLKARKERLALARERVEALRVHAGQEAEQEEHVANTLKTDEALSVRTHADHAPYIQVGFLTSIRDNIVLVRYGRVPRTSSQLSSIMAFRRSANVK